MDEIEFSEGIILYGFTLRGFTHRLAPTRTLSTVSIIALLYCLRVKATCVMGIYLVILRRVGSDIKRMLLMWRHVECPLAVMHTGLSCVSETMWAYQRLGHAEGTGVDGDQLRWHRLRSWDAVARDYFKKRLGTNLAIGY